MTRTNDYSDLCIIYSVAVSHPLASRNQSGCDVVYIFDHLCTYAAQLRAEPRIYTHIPYVFVIYCQSTFPIYARDALMLAFWAIHSSYLLVGIDFTAHTVPWDWNDWMDGTLDWICDQRTGHGHMGLVAS